MKQDLPGPVRRNPCCRAILQFQENSGDMQAGQGLIPLGRNDVLKLVSVLADGGEFGDGANANLGDTDG